ncbi:MAG TPA: [LysW]-lysine hydrolase [Candidatus Acidoferrum sp.]|nr:[LysW]-lysine hydrolase [Candidatus Acidoferrum sp.]
MDPVFLLQRMLEIPSLSGEESTLASFLVETMQSVGLQTCIDEAGNAIGVVGEGPTEIVLLGHMDTVAGIVPVRIERNKLYGRGSVDAKGPLATFIMAAAKVGVLPGKRIVIVAATEEEAASSKGARHATKTYSPSFCIIGEPSGSRAITLAYKGRIVLAYEASSGAAHSASPSGNILEVGLEFWNSVKRWAEEWNAGKKMFDCLDPALREIRSEHDGLQESIHLKASVRIPLPLSPDDVRRDLESLKPREGQLQFWGADPPYRAPKNTPLVRAFLQAIREQGVEPSFKIKSGTSDMNVVGPVWNCPIVAYGPGDSTLDHTPNEHLDLAEYQQAITILCRVLTIL